MEEKLIILDNGHGNNTPGKRSPIWSDGKQLFEWEFNRDIVKRIANLLDSSGVNYKILVPEDKDISLKERCNRANKIYDNCGKNAILISVHSNAGGGTGWECYTSVGDTMADQYATILCNQFKEDFPEEKMRYDYSDNDPDKESQFYILVHTKCPAVLSENWFMDNEKDCRMLMTDVFRDKIAKSHFKAILKMIKL